MAQYQCVVRLRTADGVVHAPGSLVTLDDVEAQSALRQRAVRLAPAEIQVNSTPNVQQLQQEVDTLQQQVSTMEHEGGISAGGTP